MREFIENYLYRESHYSESFKTRRRYLGADKTWLYCRQFLEQYVEYQ
jgi:hypothetical protein